MLDYFDVRKARLIDPKSKEVGRENKVCVSGKAEFQSPRGDSREISNLSQKEIAEFAISGLVKVRGKK